MAVRRVISCSPICQEIGAEPLEYRLRNLACSRPPIRLASSDITTPNSKIPFQSFRFTMWY